MKPFAVVLPAAGRSTRFGDASQKKIYADLAGRAVWLRAVEPFLGRADVAQIILAIAAEDRSLFERHYQSQAAEWGIEVIDGGAERQDTVARALEFVRPDCGFVAVHDAARPCVTAELIDAVFEACRSKGAVVPGLPVSDTLKRVGDDGSTIIGTVPRAGLFAVQTPQCFRVDLLRRAHAERDRITERITDDAQLVESIGHPCHVVSGSAWNIKITTRDDLRLAEAILRLSSGPAASDAGRALGGGRGHGEASVC